MTYIQAFDNLLVGVPGECYKLDVDPTDEEDEEPDLGGKDEASKPRAEHHEHHGVIDDGSLDRLPDDGKGFSTFLMELALVAEHSKAVSMVPVKISQALVLFSSSSSCSKSWQSSVFGCDSWQG